MSSKSDLGKFLLQMVVVVLLIWLFRNSVQLADEVHYLRRPYAMLPKQMNELEYMIQGGQYGDLVAAVNRNVNLAEQPISDTTEQEALAEYLEAAFSYKAERDYGSAAKEEEYLLQMQEAKEKISRYQLLKVVEEVNQLYEIGLK